MCITPSKRRSVIVWASSNHFEVFLVIPRADLGTWLAFSDPASTPAPGSFDSRLSNGTTLDNPRNNTIEAAA